MLICIIMCIVITIFYLNAMTIKIQTKLKTHKLIFNTSHAMLIFITMWIAWPMFNLYALTIWIQNTPLTLNGFTLCSIQTLKQIVAPPSFLPHPKFTMLHTQTIKHFWIIPDGHREETCWHAKRKEIPSKEWNSCRTPVKNSMFAMSNAWPQLAHMKCWKKCSRSFAGGFCWERT